jgi:hypothetical protein
MSNPNMYIEGDFSQPNAKLMATALFIQYLAYAVFSIADGVKKEGAEYVYLNEKMAQALKERAAKGKEEAAKKKEEAKRKKEEKAKAKQDKKDKKGAKGKSL